jgi:protein-tyrosine phosphatase
MKILMVCLGNICRSPLAEGIMQDKIKKAGLDWVVDSAGTGNYHVGSPPHHLSQKVAKDNGIDICEQCCRQFVKQDMLNFDKIYVMDHDNYKDVRRISKELWNADKVDFLLNELYPGENRDVPDPWYGDEEDFYTVFELLDKACERALNNLRNLSATTNNRP